MSSGIRFVSSRHGLWLGAACLLLLSVGVWISVRFGDSPAPEARSTERLEAERPPVKAVPPPEPPPVAAPPVVRRDPPTPPPQQQPPPPAGPVEVTETPAPPVPPPAEKVAADPFEPQDDQDAPIRTLVSVGDIQLGVVREATRIRDEAGLKKVLVRIGDELDKRLREPQEPGAPKPQELLDGYREELGKYMDGEVELRGPGFMIGAEVGPPLPREQWWKPRNQ
ncbi:hypothetical protein [Archangium sp.]|uniref:hypothetical protein n=1 Tax=Archangium sp. TaxID=1872627 RepID=UPI002D28A4C7|nr:hypothetical protein [Archangium sp.]HYO59726.1 hypothetical protein [Archangium sp.]